MSAITFPGFTVGAGGSFPGPPDAVITRQPILPDGIWQGPTGEQWAAMDKPFTASCDQPTGNYMIVQEALDYLAGNGRVELEFDPGGGSWNIRLYLEDGTLFHTMSILGTGTDVYNADPASPSGTVTMDVDVTQIPAERQVLAFDPFTRTTRWDSGIDHAANQAWTGTHHYRNADGIYLGDSVDRIKLSADNTGGGRLNVGTPTTDILNARQGLLQLSAATNAFYLGPGAAYPVLLGTISDLKMLCPTTGPGLFVADSSGVNPKAIDAGPAVFGDSLQTATGFDQLLVRKGGTGGTYCFRVQNRDGAYLDCGIDRYLNVTRDGNAGLQVGIGGGGLPTIRTANDNLPLFFQGRGTTDAFGGCLFLVNRTDPTDPAATPLLRVGVGLAYTSIARTDLEVFTGLHTKFHYGIQAPNLPTADPAVAGAIWNDAGTLKVSAG